MARPITPAMRQLSRATKLAVQAAGGLEVCAAETGLSTSQLSRCCSPTDPDSLSIRDAEIIDSLSQTGWPHMLHALASLASHTLVQLPGCADDPDGLIASVLELSSELGDVARSISEGARDGITTPREAQRTLDELGEMMAAAAKLHGKVLPLAFPPEKGSN